ncbi:hypothetical protein [Gordonia sp. ABSL49_1]|nr:hypothetical protein [Gordonia sp. ABSL49_1]
MQPIVFPAVVLSTEHDDGICATKRILVIVTEEAMPDREECASSDQ